MNKSPSTSVLSVRVNAEERALLEAAAELAQTNLSDFVRRRAVEAAEADVLSRTVVTIPAADWDSFEAWAKQPARQIPAIMALMKRAPGWEP